jgi:hypothetical protein
MHTRENDTIGLAREPQGTSAEALALTQRVAVSSRLCFHSNLTQLATLQNTIHGFHATSITRAAAIASSP